MLKTSIKSMILKNFRNHDVIKLDLSEDNNLIGIIDNNGTGKTNILEAISLLSPGSGLRSASLSEIPKQNTSEFFCSFEVQIGDNVSQKIDILYQNNRKKISINDKTISSQMELRNILGMVWITPEIQIAIAGSNSERRKFFDRVTFNFKSDHAQLLINYEKLLKERLKILHISDNINNNSWLNSIERQIAELSIKITQNRIISLEEIKNHINNSNLDIDLSITCDIADIIRENGDNANNIVLQKIINSRQTDKNQSRNNIGCHKYKVNLTYTKKNADIEICSSGEKKYVIISLLIAIAKSISDYISHSPIVLIDEFTSFIDANLREALLERLLDLNCQIWFTGIEKPTINYEAKYYSIDSLKV